MSPALIDQALQAEQTPRPPARSGAGNWSGPLGWTIRMGWADGTHTLVGYCRSHPRAERRAQKLAAYWCRGPIHPCSYRVVAVRRDEWRAHTALRTCTDQHCP